MSSLVDTIAFVNEREINANEQSLADCFAKPPSLSPEAQQQVIPFVRWCQMQKVRALPARPTSVAAYVRYQQDQGVSREAIAERLDAIEQVHWAASLASPVATPVVRTTTTASTIEPPRSWTKEEKFMFTGLPPEIQRVIKRRDEDREKQMRRAQNDAASFRRLKADTATKTADNETKGIEMARKSDKGWNDEVQGGETPRFDRSKDTPYTPPKSIAGKVDKASNVDGGFSGELPKDE